MDQFWINCPHLIHSLTELNVLGELVQNTLHMLVEYQKVVGDTV